MPNHFRAIGATTFLSPIPAVMLSCRGTEPGFDKDNLITVAWAGVINSAPPMISVTALPPLSVPKVPRAPWHTRKVGGKTPPCPR